MDQSTSNDCEIGRSRIIKLPYAGAVFNDLKKLKHSFQDSLTVDTVLVFSNFEITERHSVSLCQFLTSYGPKIVKGNFFLKFFI